MSTLTALADQIEASLADQPALTAHEASRLCGVSERQLRYLIDQGRVDGISRARGGHRRFRLAPILRLAAQLDQERGSAA